MSSNLSVKIDKENDKTIVSFTGQIDEDSDFTSVLSLAGNIIFDLKEISLINSCGIREWISFQQKLPGEAKIIYRNCPQVIVEQMNIVKGFVRTGGIIESFYAPYYCESKDEEIKILLTPAQIVQGKAPVLTHPETGEDLEFDDIETQYFNFLKNK